MSEKPFSCTPTCQDFLDVCKRLRNSPKFHPGDVVNVGRHIQGDDKVVFYSDKDKSTGLPLRYRVEGTTEEGLVYGKLLSSKTGKSHILNWNTSLQIDREYMDMLILDSTDTFDPTAELKAEKKKVTAIRKHNKALTIKISTIKEWDDLLSTWEVGKKMWVLWDGKMEKPTECMVVKVEKRKNDNFRWGCKDLPHNYEYTTLYLEAPPSSEGYTYTSTLDCVRLNPQYNQSLYISEQEPLVYKKKGEV